MSFALLLVSLAAGIAVSNERGVFVPVHSVREALDDIAKAFTAIALPPGDIHLENVHFVLPNGRVFDRAVPKAFVAQLMEPAAPPTPAPLFAPPAEAAPLQLAQNDAQQPINQSTADQAPVPGGNTGENGGFSSSAPPPPNTGTTAANPGSNPTEPLTPGNPGIPSQPVTPPTPTGAVPEPSSWAMMIFGFGLIGLMQRRRRRLLVQS